MTIHFYLLLHRLNNDNLSNYQYTMMGDFLYWIEKKWGEFLLWLDRKLVGKSWKQLTVVLVLFLCILVAITTIYKFSRHERFDESFHQSFVDMTNPETIRESVYDNKKGFWIVFGLALVYVFGAVFFTGLLIATVTNIWRARSDKFRRGAVRYKFNGHIVFLGYNSLIAGMIQKICEKEASHIKDVRIIVGVEDNASSVCDKIKNRLYDDYRDRVVILKVDSCNRNDLERLNIVFAKEVYIIGEHDDAYNLKCYRTIYELSLCEPTRKTRMPECYVNLHSQATLTLFRTYASSGDLGIDFTKFHSFSFYDEWARTMIQSEWKSNENHQDHFFIAGMTEMGIALARKVALLCHNPNDKHTIITFIDNEAVKKSKLFILQHQELFDHCLYRTRTKNGSKTHYPEYSTSPLDIEFEFVEGDLSDSIVRHIISRSTGFLKQHTTIALCYDDPQQNITMGLNLPEFVYDDCNNVHVWLYQTTLGDLGNYLKNSRYNNVETFGMLGDDLDVQNKENIRIAKLINHYFRHQDGSSLDYSKYHLIDTEWEGASISERWACVRRSEFIAVLYQYLKNNSKMENLECQRSAVDNLLFPIMDDDCYIKPLCNYSSYVENIQRIIYSNLMHFQQAKRKR